LTENKENYLREIASEMKKEIFEHQDYISGRYSVLSETGMLPACLMGLDIKKFKRLDYLINDKNFVNQLILNVNGILNLYNNKKTNSIILNYDENSNDLFLWYQQLVAESLGKKSKGILPVISSMPKDNHSLMQLYLDGKKNNFFTFFMVDEKSSIKIRNKFLTKKYSFLYNKRSFKILKAQFQATQNIFKKKKIPFRTFIIKERSEKVLGDLFCFFILETIMLGKALNLNPFDQPEVELIKKETYKILNFN
jgi:glucose-6-phosphate isomerase